MLRCLYVGRCGGDRHSLWTCKQDKKTKTTSWVVDTNTGPDGNNCEVSEEDFLHVTYARKVIDIADTR